MTPVNRAGLAFCAAGAYAAWIAGVGSARAGAVAPAASADITFAHDTVAAAAIRRDPFTGGETGGPPPDETVGHIRLIATRGGATPLALVDDDGRPQLLRAGDRIGTLRVATIDDAGIAFDGGARLSAGGDGN